MTVWHLSPCSFPVVMIASGMFGPLSRRSLPGRSWRRSAAARVGSEESRSNQASGKSVLASRWRVACTDQALGLVGQFAFGEVCE